MKTSTQLAKKLSAYSFFAGAFLLAEKSKAQIIYHDIIPDDTIHINEPDYFIDLNNDGQIDYRIINFHLGNENEWLIRGGEYNSAFVEGYYSSANLYADAIEENNLICKSNTWVFATFLYLVLLNYLSYGNTFGQWKAGMTDRYLGLRFDTATGGGITHSHAWIRMDVAPDATYLILKDYAYNSLVDSCIIVGEGFPLTISEINSESIQIYPNPSIDKIFLLGMKGDANREVSVFDFSGRKIFSQKISAEENSLDISSLDEGIYLLELKNENETLVKKFEVKR